MDSDKNIQADNFILESALKRMTILLNDLVGAIESEKPIDKKLLMKAKSYLPKQYSNSFKDK